MEESKRGSSSSRNEVSLSQSAVIEAIDPRILESARVELAESAQEVIDRVEESVTQASAVKSVSHEQMSLDSAQAPEVIVSGGA